MVKSDKVVFEIKHDFSNTPAQYELRLPYQNYQSSGCDMKLHRVTIEANNQFDAVGFAKLRIYPPIMDDDKPIALNSKIEARDCEPYYSKDYQRWTNGFGCYYFIE